MISYEPLRKTLELKNMTASKLFTDYRIRVNDALLGQREINTDTLEKLCNILDCSIDDVCCWIPEEKKAFKGCVKLNYDKVQEIMKSKGISAYKISVSMGKKPSYFKGKINTGSAIRSVDIDSLLNALGCSLEDISEIQ